MRGDVSEQETLLLSLYKQLAQRRAELERIKQEQLNAKKNATPLVKKAPVTKSLTKEETKRMVANASSATERAKALMASGKLKIEQKQSSGFKRRPGGGGGARRRPLEVESKKPKIEMPMYADDEENTSSNTDLYGNIPSGEVDLENRPKPPNLQKRPPNPKPIKKVAKPPLPKREAVVYDDLFD